MKRFKIKTLRGISLAIVIGFVCFGLAFDAGTGTPSAWGVGLFNIVCPLGAIEAAIASKTLALPAFIGAALVVVATLVVGKAFCSWGCPVPLLQRAARGKKRENKPARAAESPVKDSRVWVLVGALASTAIAGFPVFCLVCPVGLAFATLAGLWHLLQFNETSISLIVFPAVLVVELIVLRSWCHRLCPLGALLSLAARANKTMRPSVDKDACLKASQGDEACGRCVQSCPETLDLHEPGTALHECTKCGSCADSCPVHAISFPFFKAKKERAPEEGALETRGEDDQNDSMRSSSS